MTMTSSPPKHKGGSIPLEDFLKWIHAQPKDKLVNMSEFDPKAPCGCLMVQYGKEKGIQFSSCYLATWEDGRFRGPAARLVNKTGNLFNVFHLFTSYRETPKGLTTYAELISHFRPEHQQPCAQ